MSRAEVSIYYATSSWVQSCDQMVRQRAKREINSCLCMPKGVKEKPKHNIPRQIYITQSRMKKNSPLLLLLRQGQQIRNDRTEIKSEIPASQREIKSRDCFQENVSYLQDCIEQPEIWIPSTLEPSQKQDTTHLIYKEFKKKKRIDIVLQDVPVKMRIHIQLFP